MQTKITARHFDLTGDLKDTAEAELEGLGRYFDNIISAEMVLDAERHRRSAEITIHVYSQTINAHAETDDFITAISSAADKAKAQLKKYKSKLRDKKPEEITGKTETLTRPQTDVDELDA